MAKATERDRDVNRLETILELIDHVRRRVSSLNQAALESDRDEMDLTAYRLSAIGELSNKLSQSLRARHPDLPWSEMYALRNVVSHDYARVNAVRVWAAAHRLDEIEAMCRAELEQ